MPYQVVCPNCSAKLKSSQPVAVGRTLTCPQCKKAFVLSEPAAEVDTQPLSTKPAGESAPPRRGSRAEMDDIESADIVDGADFDYESRPKSRKQRDEYDEDDRPRSRGRRDEDDQEPHRSRRSRYADEEDDRPSKRKTRADDDGYDDDEASSRSRKNKKPNKALLIGLIAGAAGLFLLLVCGGLIRWADPFDWFGSSSSEMLAWVPSEMQSVEGADVEAVSKNTKIMNMIRSDVKDVENVGIKLEDMSAYIIAKRSPKGNNELYVVKLKSNADKDKIIKAVGGTETTASGKKYYRTKDHGALYFASDKMLVLAKSENTLTPLLAKDSGKIVVSDEMKSAVKRADGNLWAVAIGSESDPFGNMGKGGPPGFTGPPPAKSAIMTANLLSGGDANLKFEITYADAEAAKKAQTSIETMFNLVKLIDVGAMKKTGNDAEKIENLKKMFETAKFEASGAVLTIKMTGQIDSFGDPGKGGFGR